MYGNLNTKHWKRVLIETYWNVKMTPAQTSGYKKVVLIETYWNVKGY